MVIEALRLLAAAYLLVLAVAAALGLHRSLLFYPLHATYATARIGLLILTLGRVRLTPLARGVRRRQARRFRSLRAMAAEWRENREDAHELDAMEAPQWQAGTPPAPTALTVTSAVAARNLYSREVADSEEYEQVEPPGPPPPTVPGGNARSAFQSPLTASSPIQPPLAPPVLGGELPPWAPQGDEDEIPPSLWK